MKILKLKLRGAIGIRKGLGLEEIEIDFTQFQSGLIALTGRNGSGKTTIMENLHPYRMMVSRDGSLQNHFYLKDSYRILEFEFNGSVYESRILIDALTGGSEAYLFQNGKPMNDGKVSSYDIVIENLLGSPELFFNSVFSGQKSKGIAELKPADRRKLFYELLNLNSYEVYLEKAKLKLKLAENDLAKIEGEISALQQDQTSIDILEEQRKDKLNYQAQLIDEISELESHIEMSNEKVREIEVKIQIAHQKVLANEQIQKELKEIEKQIQSIATQNNSKIARYQGDIEDQKKLIERYKKLATPEAKQKIENALKEKTTLIKYLQEFKDNHSELMKEYNDHQREISGKLKDLNELEKFVNQKKSNYEIAKREVIAVHDRYKEKVARSKTIETVPCDEAIGSSCKFLLDAYESKKSIPEIEKEIYDKEELLRTQLKEIEELKFSLERDKKSFGIAIDEIEKEFNNKLSENNKEIKDCEDELKDLNKSNWEKLLEELKEADNQIKLCEQSIQGHEKLITETTLSFEQNLSSLKKQAEDLNLKYDNVVLDRIKELNADLSIYKQKLTGLNMELQSSKARIDEAKQEVAKLEQLIETTTNNEKRIEVLRGLKFEIENEIKDWSFLVKAFDKTGIPVLKLENSGIEITSIANELLSIFENKFRIVFETTKLKADKKSYKESFDINIVEEDGVCEISNKSGGQQVWLETAIQLAISLVVRNQGRNIQTAFLDEKDGALDLDNAYSYIEMLRKAHQMSGVHNTFIITHRPELLDFIPQQVKLRDGILEVII